jgi:hypothetical protein
VAETRVLIIEPDKAESDRMSMRIRLAYPEAVVQVVPNMNAAAHALEGGEFDLVLYSPMTVSTIGGRSSPITEVASYLSKYQVPVMAITPNSPPLHVKQAIDSVPGVEVVTQRDFQQVLSLLEQIVKRKSGGRAAHRIEVEGERIKAKVEVALVQLQELKEEVKSALTVNWQQEQAIAEIRNQLGAIAASINDLKQAQSGASARIDTLFNLADRQERQDKFELAKMERSKTLVSAFITAAGTVIVIVISAIGAPIITKVLDQIWPPIHDPPAKIRPKDIKK